MYGNNFVAFPTAFDNQGRVKLSACADMVEFYLSQHADGFYLHGFTGEGWCMTPEMRKLWITETVKRVNHRVPVFVSVGYGSNPDDGVNLARFAAQSGADAVSTTAIRKEALIDENIAYFRRISIAANIPFYVYWHMSTGNLNNGQRLDPETLIDILKREVPTFCGFKYTDSNFYYAQRIKQYAPDVKLFTGVDQMCVAGHMMGSDGSIGALQACTCEHFYQIKKLMNEGAIEEAFSMQLRANNIYAALDNIEVGGLIPGIKYILREYFGVDAGKLSPLSPNQDIIDPNIGKRLLQRFDENIYKTDAVSKAKSTF